MLLGIPSSQPDSTNSLVTYLKVCLKCILNLIKMCILKIF